MTCRIVLALVVATLVCGAPAWAAGEAPYPAGVPNLTDPNVRTDYAALAISRLDEDPDFPVLILGRLGEGFPQVLLVIVDARNGKDTWSLQEDTPVFFLLFADPRTAMEAYLDEGFATAGKGSGKFIAAGKDGVEELMVRLRESHRRSQGLARLGASI